VSEKIKALDELVRRLRGPGGCPWDQKQTPASTASYLVEESFEAAEAISTGDAGAAMEELGDVLFQVVFLCRLYAEAGLFDLDQAAGRAAEKMIGRHPHVFGGARLETAEEVKANWPRLKEAERGVEAGSALAGVPRALPALLRAHRLGQRAGQVGFDWPGPVQVLDKVDEELAELRSALDRGQAEAAAEELGDLFFALSNLSRQLGFNGEEVLQAANRKFEDRFRALERACRERGLELSRLDPVEMDALWEEIKRA